MRFRDLHFISLHFTKDIIAHQFSSLHFTYISSGLYLIHFTSLKKSSEFQPLKSTQISDVYEIIELYWTCPQMKTLNHLKQYRPPRFQNEINVGIRTQVLRYLHLIWINPIWKYWAEPRGSVKISIRASCPSSYYLMT